MSHSLSLLRLQTDIIDRCVAKILHSISVLGQFKLTSLCAESEKRKILRSNSLICSTLMDIFTFKEDTFKQATTGIEDRL